MPDPVFDPDATYATVQGLPGVAKQQDDAYFDGDDTYVAAAPAEVEFVELKSARTGTVRLVSLAALADLL